MHFYRPAEGHRLRHDPFNSIVAPRPIGWIGTVSPNGRRNLAPYSFFNALNYTPPLIGFSSIGWKHSARNCAETGEFTWNLVTRELAERMNATSTPADVDEFEAAGLTAVESMDVMAPRVEEARVSFECRVTQQVELRAASGAGVDSWFTVGEVVGVHIDEALIASGVYDTAAAHPVTRGGGPTTYFGLADSFDLRRPQG